MILGNQNGGLRSNRGDIKMSKIMEKKPKNLKKLLFGFLIASITVYIAVQLYAGR